MSSITICNGPSCTRNFSKDIIDTAEIKLGRKIDVPNEDEISLTSRSCFTNCKNGPSVLINNKLLCQVTPKEIAFMIKTMKKKDYETLDSILKDAEEF